MCIRDSNKCFGCKNDTIELDMVQCRCRQWWHQDCLPVARGKTADELKDLIITTCPKCIRQKEEEDGILHADWKLGLVKSDISNWSFCFGKTHSDATSLYAVLHTQLYYLWKQFEIIWLIFWSYPLPLFNFMNKRFPFIKDYKFWNKVFYSSSSESSSIFFTKSSWKW